MMTWLSRACVSALSSTPNRDAATPTQINIRGSGRREERGGKRVQKRRRKKGEESLPRTDLSAIAASSLPAGLNSMFPSVRIPTKILYNSEFNAEKR